MRVVVATDCRLHRSPDGSIRSGTPADAYSMWSRYLDAFDSVTVLARVAAPAQANWSRGPSHGDAEITEGNMGTQRADGPGVTVHPLADYRGARGYLCALPSLRRAIGRVCRDAGAASSGTCYIARMPSLVGTALVAALRVRGIPYALEVVGDPVNMARQLLGGWAAGPARRQFARQRMDAAAVSYVTIQVLQRDYPPPPDAFTASYSTVRLHESDYSTEPRGQLARPPAPARLLAIGSQEHNHKGHDVLLDAVARLARHGGGITVTIVGTGRGHDVLVARARDLGIADVVTFVTVLDRPGIRAALDDADLFVLPSRTEGLPRVLLEAAARGVPAIASSVGGTVELLAGADLVCPGHPAQLAARIEEVLVSPGRLVAMSVRNRKTAERYRARLLQERARLFYVEFARRVTESGFSPPGSPQPGSPQPGSRL
ncbi:glycosyltransferase family 4 protein [Frankia sp. Cr2]|uniref:glycosyltransferase family 4 protein n=1 Tax=Frankia sp. Cr2 TaxID=3073932 RepID=UPI002AD2F50F|nr:glycosyltransferase [Frankia sp. Cr2]